MRTQFSLLLGLNLIGFVLLALVGWLFLTLGRMRFPDLNVPFGSNSDGGFLWRAASVVIGFTTAIVLHELVHGIFFFLFTGERPRFGLSAAYAYAAAPEWYLTRGRYVIVGAAPFVIITLVGIAILPALPRSALLLWWFLLTVNAGGAVGDIYVVARLMLHDTPILVNDHGDRIDVFAPI